MHFIDFKNQLGRPALGGSRVNMVFLAENKQDDIKWIIYWIKLKLTFAGYCPNRMVLYKREFLINIFFLILANVLIKPYYILVIEREFQNQAGTSAWGTYFTLFSLSMIPQILLDFGMTSYVNRRIASHPADVHLIWRQTIGIRPAMALVFLIVFLILSAASGYLNTHPELIFWIALNQILVSGILFFRAYISGLGYYRTDSLFSVSDKLLFIVLMMFSGIFYPVNQINSFLIIQCTSLLIPFLAALIWIVLKINSGDHSIKFSFPFYILKECLPYAGIFVLMVLFSRMEPVWIDLLHEDGSRQAGIYAAAYRLLDAANMMGFLFAGLLLPLFSNALAQKDQNQSQSLFDLAWKIMTVSAVLIAVPLAFYHTYIMKRLYTDAREDVLYILILTLIPLTINYLLSTLLTAANQARSMNRLFIVSILINALGHVLFTARYGALGAAWTALITQGFTSLLLTGLIIHQKIIVIHQQHLSVFLYSLILTGTAGLALKQVALPEEVEFITFIFTTLVLSLITGLIPIRSIYHQMIRPHPM